MERDILDLQGAADHVGHSRRWLRENCVSLGIGHDCVGRKFRFRRQQPECSLARHTKQGEKGGVLSMTHRDPSKPYAVTIIEGKEIYMEDLIT